MWNLEQGFEVQHELLPRVSATVSYYHGSFHNLTDQDNRNVTASDWLPLQVFNPMDGKPLTIHRSASFGTPTYLTPAGILNGRIIALGAQARW